MLSNKETVNKTFKKIQRSISDLFSDVSFSVFITASKLPFDVSGTTGRSFSRRPYEMTCNIFTPPGEVLVHCRVISPPSPPSFDTIG